MLTNLIHPNFFITETKSTEGRAESGLLKFSL